MINAQLAASDLMSSLGKDNVGIELLTGAEQISDIWPQIFRIKPEFEKLVFEVSKASNQTAIKNLRVSLEKVLKENPDLLQQMQPTITIGNISADNGSVATAVNSGSTVHIENR